MTGTSCQESTHSCGFCSKSFAKRRFLTRHLRRTHTTKRFQCYDCDHAFKQKVNLVQHIRQLHLMRVAKQPSYSCVLCNTHVSNDRKGVINHYIEMHDVRLKEKQFSFAGIGEFEQWKLGVEQTDVCRFVHSGGPRNRSDFRTQYFRCSRDGNFLSESKGVRRLKVKGSNKMNGVCPAYIKAVEDKITGAVDVTFTSDHVGHCQELGRLHLTKDERAQIARKLAADVPYQAIIDQIHGSVKNNELSRIHLTTRKDLSNIQVSFKLSKGSGGFQHNNDCRSVETVEASVTLMKKESDVEAD